MFHFVELFDVINGSLLYSTLLSHINFTRSNLQKYIEKPIDNFIYVHSFLCIWSWAFEHILLAVMPFPIHPCFLSLSINISFLRTLNIFIVTRAMISFDVMVSQVTLDIRSDQFHWCDILQNTSLYYFQKIKIGYI